MLFVPSIRVWRKSIWSAALGTWALGMTHAGADALEPQRLPTQHVPGIVATHAAMLIGRPNPAQQFELAISLPLRNQAGLDALLANLYDPASPQYRHFLSAAEFTARFGPSIADYGAIENFAVAHGLTIREGVANRLVLDVRASVEVIDRTFHLSLGLYREPTTNRLFFAPDREPTLDLAVPVLHVGGLDNLIRPQPRLVRNNPGGLLPRASGSGPAGNFLGSDVRAAYYGGTALTGAGQSVALLEFGPYDPGDVARYFTVVHQPFAVPLRNVSVNGVEPISNCSAVSRRCDDSEQVLDIEEAVSMAPGLKQLVVYVGSTAASMLARMAADDSSRQISSSWGWNPTIQVDEPIFKEFAAQGQSFVDATGDDGYHLKLGAIWPGDDAYVTGVGGTDLATRGAGGPWAAETGWRYSGGGPSPDGIRIPTYQKPFINRRNDGSPTLRNAPDIAGDADTDNFSCYDGSCSTGNGGTSYAAPLWAGFLALANQEAARRNLPPIGFLNPTLYRLGGGDRYPHAFHDQTQGFNGRYTALRGFDLVTGFGSPAGQPTIEALIVGQ